MTLNVVLLIILADLPEGVTMLSVYNNRCLRCTYNPFAAKATVHDRSYKRATELHSKWREMTLAARNQTHAAATLAPECQAEGMHFATSKAHASLSLPHPNIFRAVLGIGHLVELGVLLRLVQGIACEIHRLGDPIFTDVNARLRTLRAERPFFGGVRPPSATNITSLFSRRSPMTATELISVAPLLLVAIRGITELEEFAWDLKEGLYVLSFCYEPAPRESELQVWQRELDQFQHSVLSGTRVTTPPKWEEKKKKDKSSDKKNDTVVDNDKKEKKKGTCVLSLGSRCVKYSASRRRRVGCCNQEPHHHPLTRHDARGWCIHCRV